MKRNIIFALTFYIAILCIPQYAMAQSYTAPAGEIYREYGIASWYGPEYEGRPTASGEIFNSTLFTAGHPSLPFGTFLIVTNRNNNRQVTVKVNDRGPFVASWSIELSKAAADHLDLVSTGTAPVIIETLPTSYLQSPPGTSAVTATPAQARPSEPQAPVAVPEPPAAVPEPEPVPEPVAQVPPTGTPGFPYPPITVNVYPSAPPPQAPAQAQAEPQYQPQSPDPQFQYQAQPQYQPQYPPQPQYQAQPYPPQPQYQPQPPQSTYPFPPPIVPSMQMPPYQESYYPPPPVQPTVEYPPQAPAVRLIPAINPLPGTTYRLQVGSYKTPRNAVDAFEKLKAVGLNPGYEQHGEFYRVVLATIPGTEVMSVVDKLGRAGFREAIIRVEQ